MVLQMALLHCFSWLSSIPFYICTTSSLSIHLLMGHLGCFHVLAIVNSAAMNIGVRVSFWIIVLSGYMPRSGIAGSHCYSIFGFFEEPPYLGLKCRLDCFQKSPPPTRVNDSRIYRIYAKETNTFKERIEKNTFEYKYTTEAKPTSPGWWLFPFVK